MASATGDQIYATLLLTDTYLPGALVLAHSLRDAGTSKKLAVYYTADSVSSESISQLKSAFDHVLPVPRIRTEHPDKLYLMNRPDLESAFTKINLWTQTQFSKIVYVDADVVAYRAPDELFDIPHAFAAAPDIGWPDIFNTGVMVLTPDLGDYYALLAMAERGISFDGADQGLLNMYFKNSVHRLSFTYNVTPSGHYQYVPAYRHFQSSINLVHFIGPNKPWFEGRYASRGGSPYDEMVGRWWTVYDRHYRAQESAKPEQSSHYVQYFTKGEFQPAAPQPVHTQHESHGSQRPTFHEPKPVVPGSTKAITEASEEKPSSTVTPIQLAQELKRVVARQEERRPSLDMQQSWDAQRQPPPVDSKPEAINFPATHYEMSNDASPFVAPDRYPSPPKNMWYEVPKAQPAAPRKIFPWEANQPAASRAFPSVKLDTESGHVHSPSDHTGDIFGKDSKTSGDQVIPTTTPTIQITPSDPWSSFSRSNAWDEIPEINRYVQGIQTQQRRLSGAPDSKPLEESIGEKVPGSPTLVRKNKAKGLRLTDFPSETERPSLPVTPAPIRRPSFWGDDSQQPNASQDESSSISNNNNNPAFPTAPGVPSQSEWDPSEQLERLAQQHSDELLRRLSGAGMEDAESLPVPQEGESQSESPTVLSPKPIKAEAATSGLVFKMVEAGDEESKASAQEES